MLHIHSIFRFLVSPKWHHSPVQHPWMSILGMWLSYRKNTWNVPTCHHITPYVHAHKIIPNSHQFQEKSFSVWEKKWNNVLMFVLYVNRYIILWLQANAAKSPNVRKTPSKNAGKFFKSSQMGKITIRRAAKTQKKDDSLAWFDTDKAFGFGPDD